MVMKLRKKQQTKNTRAFKRLNAYYLLKYDASGNAQVSHLTNIKNISAGGAKFFSEKALREQDLLKLHVLIPPLEKSFHAEARILRVRKMKKYLHYSVAVCFVNIRPEDQKAVDDYIENLSGEPQIEMFIDQGKTVSRER
ncbi:MAG: PilZ domain-containing protein [Candidatus Omnitrophota bacterium]